MYQQNTHSLLYYICDQASEWLVWRKPKKRCSPSAGPRTLASTVELHAKCIQIQSAKVKLQSGEELEMSEAVVQDS